MRIPPLGKLGLIKKKVMNSPTCSSKKIKSDLNETGISVSRRTVSRRLVEEFGLMSRKPERKPRLTLKMKKKRLQFALQHKDWTCAQWSNALFLNESTVQQFAVRKKNVRKSQGIRYNKSIPRKQ